MTKSTDNTELTDIQQDLTKIRQELRKESLRIMEVEKIFDDIMCPISASIKKVSPSEEPLSSFEVIIEDFKRAYSVVHSLSLSGKTVDPHRLLPAFTPNRDTNYDVHKTSEENKLYELLITEKFRQYLLKNNIADDYVLFQEGYSKVQGMIGSFKEKSRALNPWVVYEVDEDGKSSHISFFSRPEEAFSDAAMRNNLVLSPSDLEVKKTANGNIDYKMEQKTLESARKFLEIIASFYQNASSGISAQNSIKLIDRYLIS